MAGWSTRARHTAAGRKPAGAGKPVAGAVLRHSQDLAGSGRVQHPGQLRHRTQALCHVTPARRRGAAGESCRTGRRRGQEQRAGGKQLAVEGGGEAVKLCTAKSTSGEWRGDSRV